MPGQPVVIGTIASSNSIIIAWRAADDGIVVRGYVVGWGKSYLEEHTVTLNSDQQYYSIEGLGDVSNFIKTSPMLPKVPKYNPNIVVSYT